MHLANFKIFHPFIYVGLGLIFSHEKTPKKVFVSALAKHGSAAQAGIEIGDIVIAIDDTCFNPIERESFYRWEEEFLPIPENTVVHIIVQKPDGAILQLDCTSVKTISLIPLRCLIEQLKNMFLFYCIDPLKPVGIGWDIKRQCLYVNQRKLPSDDDIDEILR